MSAGFNSGSFMVIADIRVGDVYRLKKPHPCGSYEWRVTRIGADIGMRCTRCQHRVLLARTDFERRIKSLVSRDETRE